MGLYLFRFIELRECGDCLGDFGARELDNVGKFLQNVIGFRYTVVAELVGDPVYPVQDIIEYWCEPCDLFGFKRCDKGFIELFVDLSCCIITEMLNLANSVRLFCTAGKLMRRVVSSPRCSIWRTLCAFSVLPGS